MMTKYLEPTLVLVAPSEPTLLKDRDGDVWLFLNESMCLYTPEITILDTFEKISNLYGPFHLYDGVVTIENEKDI